VVLSSVRLVFCDAYAIDIFEVRTSLGGSVVTDTEAHLRLLNHSLDVPRWQGERCSPSSSMTVVTSPAS
jgi:hypothetical protein